MSKVINKLELAQVAYDYALANYNKRNARFDVIVECMEKSEIAEQFEFQGISSKAAAIKWAKQTAGLQREKQLNQAWDGPESCEPGYEF